MMTEGIRERLGDAVGKVGAPLIERISRARHGRTFHPEGLVFEAHVDPLRPGLAEDLGGRALVRVSPALWRGLHERFEVLGMAIRFRQSDAPFDDRPQPGDSDLLVATIRSPLTMALSPLFTDASDFVGNRYWGVSPFEYDGERFEIRLSPLDPRRAATEGTRTERLLDAVDAQRAQWWVEMRRTLHLQWHAFARIDLIRELAVDQEALRFDPFRGVLRPVGFVQAIRRAVYAASQAGRP